MPIDQLKSSIHVRRKKNRLVFDNLARLEQIARSSHSQAEILQALHPWNAPMNLQFSNQLPIFLGICGAISLLPTFCGFSHTAVYLLFIAGVVALFWAYLTYEQQTPVYEVIDRLEQSSIQHKYQLAFHQQPAYLERNLNPALFVSQLKQLYPIFSRGNISNDIPFYASSAWQDAQGRTHQVLIFEYQYVHEISITDHQAEKIKIREERKTLWGIFLLDVDLPLSGLAFTTQNSRFAAPYIYPWHSSDIQSNQQMKIYVDDELKVAKQFTPSHVLRISHFLQQQPGDLIFHPSHQSLCFLSHRPLLKVQSKAKNIQDISQLRGHLRTFKLPYLERLQHDLMHLMNSYH